MENETEVMELSLYTFMGISSLITTRLKCRIGKTSVIVVIDSGETHNLISPLIVEKAHLPYQMSKKLKMLVDTCITVE